MLNSRQWMLYRYIKENSIDGRWTSQDEILTHLNANTMPVGYKTSKNGHDKCSAIWSDIENINFSAEIEKIVIKDGKKNYRLATSKEESVAYAKTFLNKALKSFKRYHNLMSKIEADGQGKLISAQGKVIDEKSKAREFVEAFIKEIEKENE